MSTIDNFIELLSSYELDPEITENPYFGNTHESNVRKHNLKLYLEKMKELNPEILLLGEAPGYKGCALTGIPFTSEYVLARNEFFKGLGYQFIDKDRREKEASATIVWNELNKYENKPLMWNIFPFHPHKKGEIKSNRTPNKKELELGGELLLKIKEIVPAKVLVAVGNNPALMLKNLGFKFEQVRHPANGGKVKFQTGLKEIFAKD